MQELNTTINKQEKIEKYKITLSIYQKILIEIYVVN